MNANVVAIYTTRFPLTASASQSPALSTLSAVAPSQQWTAHESPKALPSRPLPKRAKAEATSTCSSNLARGVLQLPLQRPGG
jgi:hypothetical protein